MTMEKQKRNKWQRLLAKLLSAALAAGLLSNAVPMEARAEAAAVSIANPYRGCICLNGNAVIIADGAGAGLTKLYADTNATAFWMKENCP